LTNELQEISTFYKISPMQAYIFGVIFNLSLNSGKISLKDIANHLGVKPVAMLEYYQDLKTLSRKKLLKASGDDDDLITDFSFSVTNETAVSLISGCKLLQEVKKSEDVFSFFDDFTKVIEEAEINSEDYKSYLEKSVISFLSENSGLSVAKKIKSLGATVNEIIFLNYLCGEFLVGNNKTDLSRGIDNVLSRNNFKFEFRKLLISKESKLIKKGLIDLVPDAFGGYDVNLTNKCIESFFGKDSLILISTNAQIDDSIIKPDNLVKKNLYYNSAELKEITLLENAFKPSNYKRMMSDLKKENMPESLTVLLYGTPGTGKTETVYQIAQRTKREIYRVDISDTKSMWFGKSEKLIKDVFDNYRKFYNLSKKAPILFFNEADGILSKRKSVESSNVAKTENAMQNIILQELEEFKGIFFATTNLTDNLDFAFERRFLFKIKLSNPDVQVRNKIWRNNISGLSDQDVEILSRQFSFSGAQIFNIKKKILMTKILTGSMPDINEIKNICQQESISSNMRKVGF
ncbi:MAG: ATP-binding protein, partial [Bacteroidales bacterium]|nr:ATP-binding protein [Bacteroidales bacterium]